MAEEQIKDCLLSLGSEHLRLLSALANENSEKGTICWDAGFAESMLFAALLNGLALAGTDCTHEWIVTGPCLLATIRSHPEYIEYEVPEFALGIVRVGTLRFMRVYLWTGFQIHPNELFVGNHDYYARVSAMNLPLYIQPGRGVDDRDLLRKECFRRIHCSG